jgi:hypothetical protein
LDADADQDIDADQDVDTDRDDNQHAAAANRHADADQYWNADQDTDAPCTVDIHAVADCDANTNALMLDTLSRLGAAIVRSIPGMAWEPSGFDFTSEVRRLRTFEQVREASPEKKLLVLYREGDAICGMDIYRTGRFEWSLEEVHIRMNRRYPQLGWVLVDKLLDYTWQFRYLLVNTESGVWTVEPILGNLLGEAEWDANDFQIGEA